MEDITNKFEEIFDLSQALQDKVLELSELIASPKENTTD